MPANDAAVSTRVSGTPQSDRSARDAHSHRTVSTGSVQPKKYASKYRPPLAPVPHLERTRHPPARTPRALSTALPRAPDAPARHHKSLPRGWAGHELRIRPGIDHITRLARLQCHDRTHLATQPGKVDSWQDAGAEWNGVAPGGIGNVRKGAWSFVPTHCPGPWIHACKSA